jgi:hypothetical protein
MHVRSNSLPPTLRTSASRWFVLVAIIWAIVSGPTPAQSQPIGERALPGFDLRGFMMASDRAPSLQTGDRRHPAAPSVDNQMPGATCSIVAALVGSDANQPTVFVIDDSIARQQRSPAQPRAPPAHAKPSH